MVNQSKNNQTSSRTVSCHYIGVLIVALCILVLMVGGGFLLKGIINNHADTNSNTGGSMPSKDSQYYKEEAQKVATAIANYRNNNRGKMPAVSKCFVDSTDVSILEDENGVFGACKFIKFYLNTYGGTKNEFVDLNGEPYDLVILKTREIPVTKTGTFYVYPNGRCGDNQVLTSNNSFAVSYKISDNADLICVEEPLDTYYTVDE